MNPTADLDALLEYVDHLRTVEAAHVPPAVRLAGDVAVSAWKNGFSRALLLVVAEHVRVGRGVASLPGGD